MKLVSTKFIDLVPVERFRHKPMGMYDGRFLMELLQCHKVCEIGGDKLRRPPVVALRIKSNINCTNTNNLLVIRLQLCYCYRQIICIN